MTYLDSNATTQIDPRVLDAMLPYLKEHYANPSASYGAARQVRRAVEEARGQVAALLDCESEEITFMSGGTESCNAAVFSALTLRSPHKEHLVVVKTEHSAVLEVAKRWMQEGRPVNFIDVDRGGRVDVEVLDDCMRTGQTAVLSLMWANNETGVLGAVDRALVEAHARGALFHTDAVQAVGKIPISVKKTPVDYLSLSGHKFHAPKGIGALYVSKRVRFKPWMLGGGQESGRRSGTENVPHIVGMGLAAELMRKELEAGGEAKVQAMRDAFERHVCAALPDTLINGDLTHRLPNTSSMTFSGIDAPGMLILLDERGIACSAGSACHTATLHPSHVLEAMGLDAEHARSTLRFSWSRFNTMEDTLKAAEETVACARKMRDLRGEGPVAL